MTARHTLLVALGVTSAVLGIDARTAHAQLAPTGSHYGARASDTGHSSVSGTGGYSTSVALELNPARGGLPIPVAITNGGRGVGAAGLGWDLPLSFVRRDTTVARRRPAYQPGGAIVGREQITVSLAGSTIQMVQRDANVWVARQDAPDLELRSEGPNAWRLLDGAGREYVFKAPDAPIPDLWLLDSISAANNTNIVKLEYAVVLHDINNSVYFRGKGHSIDLLAIKYNTHPTQAGCFKDVVRLTYNINAPLPLHSALLGSSPVFRMRTLREVAIARAEGCGSESVVRRYELKYLDDPDTKATRLHKVLVHGRDGIPEEATTSLPVAEYNYGTATSNLKLAFQRGPDIALPADVGSVQILASTFHDGNASTPDGGRTYVSWQNLIDVTGDGRADLVFRKNNQLWVAINRPDGSSSTTLIGGPAKLLAPANDNRPLAEHSSETLRNDYSWETRSQDWRKVIDVNGDGRLDIVDAEESDGQWVVYLNTPGDPVTWVKRYINTFHVKSVLESMGHVIEGNRVPLSRRTTGYDTSMLECWIWDSNVGHYVEEPNFPGVTLCEFDPGTTVVQERVGSEKTYVEWTLKDVNGDGYPDVVFNSVPVKRSATAVLGAFTTFARVEVTTRALSPVDSSTHVLLNVAGVRLDTENVFSSIHPLGGDPGCAPESWFASETGSGNEQRIGCALEDVNGDGVLDRITGGYAYLNVGNPFNTSTVKVFIGYNEIGDNEWPLSAGRSRNDFQTDCVDDHEQETTESKLTSFRDMNGDGLQDIVIADSNWKVAFGTGTGFTKPVVIESSTFALSQSVDHCAGEYSRTTDGLYDVDGDGKPEVVHIAHNPARLEVYYLTGGVDGTAAAGRLTSISNGYGATTQIKYRSAKEHASSVPFPEIVVTSVETTGSLGGGGSLSAVHYAYGEATMYFDPAADAFTTRGYERVVEVYGTGLEEGQADFAIIRQTQHLPPYNPGMSDAERFARYQLAGRPIKTFLLGHDVPRDAWQLLASFDPFMGDFRQIGETHQEWKAAYQPITATTNVADCADIPDPYNWTQPPWLGAGLPLCQSRGFSYVSASEQWSGTQPPPASSSNVQTRFEVLEIDAHGNVLRARNENDLFDTDDDVCVEMSYAQPTTSTRIFSALAQRKATNCAPMQEARTLSFDSWEYDSLPGGSVASGRVTSHGLVRHATDNGENLGDVREYELGYDAVGNVDYMVTARRDGAVRALEIFHDEFGLVPVGSRLDATGLPPIETSTTRDPVTLAAISEHDVNGTTWGQVLDGFGRVTRSTVTPHGGSLGVTSTTTYVGFSGASPSERRIHRKQFQDPVPPNLADSRPGQETVAYLDELGRTRRVEQKLGDDYANESLVVLSRVYDGLGRVSFEADAHPASEDSSTAYGTTYHFGTDGMLRCSIRGNGPQAFNSVSDLASERFPTCVSRVFTNHTVQLTVSTPDTLVAGSPQTGVLRTDTMNAVGRVRSRETTKNGTRLELSEYKYDLLGQLTALVRHRAPATGSESVEWSWRHDSVGQVLSAREPELADRFNTYSDWGELLTVDWTDNSVPMRLDRNYDALGRITWSVETENGHVFPGTEYDWFYDTDQGTPLPSSNYTLGRLTRTRSAIGDMYLSYDAFGSVESRAFVDENFEPYIEKYERHFDGALATLEFQLPDTGYSPERYKYSYDSALRLRTVDHVGGQSLFAANTTDAFGRLRSASYGENISVTANYAEVGRRLPIEQEISHTGGATRRIAYDTYDAIGRVLGRHEDVDGSSGSVTTNNYDELGRLATSLQTGAHAFNTTFSYDALGNVKLLADAVTANVVNLRFQQGQGQDRDRLCRIDYGPSTNGPCNVEYDDSGNITHQPARDGHNRRLTYYPSGAIRQITRSDPSNGDIYASFGYDGSGEMSTVDIDGPHQSPAEYLDRHDRRYGLIERRQTGDSEAVIIRRIPGAGASRHGANGPWIFPFGEERGTRFVSDDGKFVQDVSYLPFGEATSSGLKLGDPGFANNQWNGGDALDALGVVQVGARVYDPAIGRFLSRDPLIVPRSASTTNPYAFAGNDPINSSDPTGLDPNLNDPNSNSISGSPGGSGSDDPALSFIAQSFSWGFQLTMALSPSGAGALPQLLGPDHMFLGGALPTEGPQIPYVSAAIDGWFAVKSAISTGISNAGSGLLKGAWHLATHPQDILARSLGQVVPLGSLVSAADDVGGIYNAGLGKVDQIANAVAQGDGLGAIELGAELVTSLAMAVEGLRGGGGAVADRTVLAPTLAHRSDLLAYSGTMVPRIQKGFFNLIVHGSPDAFWIKDVSTATNIEVSAKTVANFARQQGWNGEPVRLISCRAGLCSGGPAQQLANELGVRVRASTGLLWVEFPTGKYGFQGKGRWKTYKAK